MKNMKNIAFEVLGAELNKFGAKDRAVDKLIKEYGVEKEEAVKLVDEAFEIYVEAYNK